jgi:hypothetical protein
MLLLLPSRLALTVDQGGCGTRPRTPAPEPALRGELIATEKSWVRGFVPHHRPQS